MSYATTPSVRARVLEALRRILLTIREEDGWKTTVLTSVIGLDQRHKIGEWPAIIVRPTFERVLSQQVSDDCFQKELEVELICLLSPQETSREEGAEFQNNILSDIERLLTMNQTIPDEDGNPTAWMVLFRGSQTFEKLEGQVFAAIKVVLSVRYYQRLTNPTTSG